MSPARKVPQGKSHMPKNSVFYEKVIPFLLGGMAVLMAVIILLAVGILVGLVPY